MSAAPAVGDRREATRLPTKRDRSAPANSLRTHCCRPGCCGCPSSSSSQPLSWLAHLCSPDRSSTGLRSPGSSATTAPLSRSTPTRLSSRWSMPSSPPSFAWSSPTPWPTPLLSRQAGGATSCSCLSSPRSSRVSCCAPTHGRRSSRTTVSSLVSCTTPACCGC